MKKFIPTLVMASLLVSCGSTEPSTDEISSAMEGPYQVLLITGGGFHDYEAQSETLTAGLSERLNIEWTVDMEAGNSTSHILSRHNEPDWTDGFDAVIYNNCHANVTDNDYIDSIAEEHRTGGVGAIFVHCAMHTYRSAETDSWDQMIGIDTYHHENQQREFDFLPVNTDHPIMADFPSGGWITPRDEIYIVLQEYENLIPLVEAYGPETETDHVVMWANTYGEARIAGTTAGHNNAVIGDPVFLDFIANSIKWVAEGN